MSETFNIINLDNKGVKKKYVFTNDAFNNNDSNIKHIKQN